MTTLEHSPTSVDPRPIGLLAPAGASSRARAGLTDIDIVIPVYNERTALPQAVSRLSTYLAEPAFPYTWSITIADNGSTDGTWEVASALTRTVPGVAAMRITDKGRGGALRQAWLSSLAAVVAYMDVDLSTNLSALLPLVAPLLSGHSDVAIGTRLAGTSQVERGPKREFISRTYNALLHLGLGAHFSDAQCGFKAMTRPAAQALLPYVEDSGWFFDTELLTLAERAGLRIFEVPVDWVDDPDSSVDIISTATADLRGMWRVRRALSTGAVPMDLLRSRAGRLRSTSGALIGQLIRFAIVGVLCTVLYVALYAGGRELMSQQWANFWALAISAVLNTSLNRRMTFGVTGRKDFWRHQAQGLAVFALALGLTSGSLWLLDSLAPAASTLTETAVVCLANLLATVLRFTLLRGWVFAHAAGRKPATAPLTQATASDTSAAKEA